MTELSFFHRDGDDLVPEDMARSLWSEDQMHGVAASGALARELEQAVRALGRDDVRPVRYTVDLFRPAGMSACRTTSSVVRAGKRLCLVDARLEQDGQVVARASAIFLKPSTDPTGEVWAPSELPSLPPLELAPYSDELRIPLFYSEDVGWSQSFADHQNGSRKQTWQTGVPIVAGEEGSAFQAAASIADATSMVTNWGSGGIEYINSDITLTLARMPVSREIGLAAVDRVAHDGLAVGTATVFDRKGPLGTALVTSLANTRRTVDFREHDFGAEA